MRRKFAKWLKDKMDIDKDIVLVTADLGFGLLDPIKNAHPDRFYNVGASEQLLLGVGVGLALEGKKPVLYSITPFLLLRPAEWIRNYLGAEDIKCMLVGSGMYDDYNHDGFSHHMWKAKELTDLLGIGYYSPAPSNNEVESIFDSCLADSKSLFLGLRR